MTRPFVPDLELCTDMPMGEISRIDGEDRKGSIIVQVGKRKFIKLKLN